MLYQNQLQKLIIFFGLIVRKNMGKFVQKKDKIVIQNALFRNFVIKEDVVMNNTLIANVLKNISNYATLYTNRISLQEIGFVEYMFKS